MQVNLDLVDVDVNETSEVFDTVIAEKLNEYLRNDCILDQNGINRVMPLLKRAYLFGYKRLEAQFIQPRKPATDDNPDGEPSPNEMEMLRGVANSIGSQISEIVIDAQLKMMYGLAATLAAHDERIYKRPRH